MTARPLDGVRVADFSHVFAGPIASYFLASLGADVIKVEGPGNGDVMRRYGPDEHYHGMSPSFVSANAGKRSIAIDLKHRDGLKIARKLIAGADVVIENFRPGAMTRLGLGYEDACALRADIIYCSVSGYGQTGPRRDHPAIDNIVQATSGMMSLCADRDSDGEVVPFPVVDTYTATLAAAAVLAALLQRARDGLAQHIDVAMMDASMALMASVVVPHLMGSAIRSRKTSGRRGYSGSPASGIFRTADGISLSLGVVQDGSFALLCSLIGRPELAADEEYATALRRLANSERLSQALAEVFQTRAAHEWEQVLAPHGIACGVLCDLPTATARQDLRDRGTICAVPIEGLPDRSEVPVINLGFRFGHAGPEPRAAPPWHGEHSREILAELGYDTARCDRLIAEGIVGARDKPRTEGP